MNPWADTEPDFQMSSKRLGVEAVRKLAGSGLSPMMEPESLRWATCLCGARIRTSAAVTRARCPACRAVVLLEEPPEEVETSRSIEAPPLQECPLCRSAPCLGCDP